MPRLQESQKMAAKEKSRRDEKNRWKRVDAINKVFGKVAVRQRDFQLCLDSWKRKVHDPEKGDTGGIEIDDFDEKPWEKAAETIAEIFIYQEIAKIFHLEEKVKDKLMENVINRKVPPPTKVSIPGKSGMHQPQGS